MFDRTLALVCRRSRYVIEGSPLFYRRFVAAASGGKLAASQAGRFPKVPGDEVEFIPLPEKNI
ncbi:MAG TPA: hypothetical protein VJV79_38865 [Polyangiaceae bacterium]|nr:hypothetical protein [Polyangiaceae bacterium]